MKTLSCPWSDAAELVVSPAVDAYERAVIAAEGHHIVGHYYYAERRAADHVRRAAAERFKRVAARHVAIACAANRWAMRLVSDVRKGTGPAVKATASRGDVA